MLKLLLIIAITIYVLSKVGRLLFGMGAYSSQNRTYRRPPDGNVNVKKEDANNKNKTTIKGGEYIDFEEVK
ncbi:MAG: hypothetical protein RIA63_14145 [Cyclobacteriaceae bacterium]